jgi:branched-chain amino acid transport system substrate-binding protein
MTRSCPVAGLYSGAVHYVKTLKTMGGNSHDGTKVAKMKELPIDDVLLGKGTIRADGRKMLPAYLFEVKKSEESKASVRW